MLFLGRKHRQSIIVNGTVKITVYFNKRRNQVTLGIDAPKSITVNREEVQKRIDIENMPRIKKD